MGKEVRSSVMPVTDTWAKAVIRDGVFGLRMIDGLPVFTTPNRDDVIAPGRAPP